MARGMSNPIVATIFLALDTFDHSKGPAEHPAVSPRDPRVLDSFLVGCHHRIAHAALVERLARKQTFSGRGNV